MTHSLRYSQYDLPLLFEEQVKYMKVKNILFFAQDLDFKKVFFKFAYLCLHFFFFFSPKNISHYLNCTEGLVDRNTGYMRH